MKLKKILAADEAHPDYEKYKRKEEVYRHEYFEKIHALKSKKLSDEEVERWYENGASFNKKRIS